MQHALHRISTFLHAWDILCVQRDDRVERAQSQGAKLHLPYLHLSPPSIIFSHPSGSRHQLAPIYEALEAWTGQKHSRGWLSLRNARRLHWPKTTDSWVHSDLEAQGLYESVFRALVPMETNENTLYLLSKSPSHISKPRAKWERKKKWDEGHRNVISRALTRFRQGWEQKVSFRRPQWVLEKQTPWPTTRSSSITARESGGAQQTEAPTTPTPLLLVPIFNSIFYLSREVYISDWVDVHCSFYNLFLIEG